MKIDSKRDSEKINVRDIITMAVCYALILLVYFLASPIGFYPKTYIFIWSICSVFWGTIFLLLYTKVNKKGVPITFSIIVALVMLTYHWVLSLIVTIGGIIAETIWRKMDRKSTKTMGIVFTVQILFWQLGSTLPLFFMLDAMKANAQDYVELFESISKVISPTLEIIAILTLLLGCFIGVFIGKKLLKKHFEKAGIV